MINIFLDDERETPRNFLRTLDVQTTINFMKNLNGYIDILSLDNDLGVGMDEGRNVVYWLCATSFNGLNYWPRRIRIHSANPVARDYMKGMIERYASCYYWDATNQEYVDDSRM